MRWRGGCRRRAAPLLAGALLVASVASCTPSRAPVAGVRTDAVVVASANFPESELLAEIYAQALTAAGVPVRRELDLGTREMVLPALREGLVDLVPEYLGSALTALGADAGVDRHDTGQVLAALRGALRPWHVQVLAPSPASDENGLAVTRATAQRLHVGTLGELARLGRSLRLAAPSECAVRPTCLPGLRTTYGLRFGQVLPLDDAAQRVTALTEGVVDVAVVFTTDGRLASGGLVLLADDRGLQPVDRIAPVVSDRALARYGERLRPVLDTVSATLTSAALRFLGWRMLSGGRTPAEEAHGWLHRHGLLHGR